MRIRHLVRFAVNGPSRPWKTLLVLALFVASGIARYHNAQGDDLASSYIGCRLIANHQADHLYSFDPTNFAAVGPDEPGNAWQAAADQAGFDSFLHPYVQTPLWAYALQPLCVHTRFPAFEATFAVLAMLCFAALLWLVTHFWAPDYAHPLPLSLLALGLWFSQPFQYAMMLVQTHILLMLLTVASLILAERRRPILAGLLLALAAAVKITPGILLLYWLLTRRNKAAASMIAWSAALAALTILTTGPHVMAAYLADIHRISRILLLSQNNQSFAAWAMGFFYPAKEVSDFHMLQLPTAMRLLSTALMIALTAAGGLIDRRSAPPTHLGAAMGLVAATIFAPIAWTHYSFILLVPLLVLAQENRTLRSPLVYAAMLGIAALNFRPLATNVEEMSIAPLAILRGQFFAGLLSLCALAFVAWKLHAAKPHAARGGVESRQVTATNA